MNPDSGRPNVNKNLIVILILILGGYLLINAYRNNAGTSSDSIPITTLSREIAAGQVKSIVISGATADVTTADDKNQKVTVTEQSAEGLRQEVAAYNGSHPNAQITLEFQSANTTSAIIVSILFSLVPVLLIGGFFIFMMKQAQGANNQAMGFGKSPARAYQGSRQTTTFADVAGCDEAKYELVEEVEFLKEPHKFTELGAKIPKGVLLVGPPGCGKTMLAKAVAGEAGVPFFSISASEFVEMFVGVGASRVRDLFNNAKKNAPCIIFIDEVDAVGRQRGAGLGGSHDEREQTLNQILVEMDGFDTYTNVIVFAATNRPDTLDPALLRPGRFDRQVVVDKPDIRGRKAILDVHIKGKPIASGVDLTRIAKISPGMSGADLANVVNEAAILAARAGKKKIEQVEFEAAFKKVAIGLDRPSRVLSEAVKRIIAYHEAGHALVMAKTELSDPVQEVSIISRGLALGYTMPLPEDDRNLMSRGKMLAEIDGLLGGFTAEEIFIGDTSTGPSNDIEKATKLARLMVARYGMSDKLGPIAWEQRQDLVFLGRDISEEQNYSNEIAHLIDTEVKRIIAEAQLRARQILTDNKETMERVVRSLLIKETLDQDQFQMLLAGSELSSS